MKNKPISILLFAFVIFISAFQTFAQDKIDGLNVSVSIENTNLSSSRRPEVKIIIENKTGNTIYLGDSTSIRLRLERDSRPQGCKRSECLVAFAILKDKLIENNKSIEAKLDLKDLYWMDRIFSSIDSKKPKNFSKSVTTGSYLLYASVSVSPNAQTSDLSKFLSLESNTIIVSV